MTWNSAYDWLLLLLCAINSPDSHMTCFQGSYWSATFSLLITLLINMVSPIFTFGLYYLHFEHFFRLCNLRIQPLSQDGSCESKTLKFYWHGKIYHLLWYDNVFNCWALYFVVILCDDIPFVRNGNKSPDKDSAGCGEKVTYTCNQGFTLVGDKELECLADGQFSGKVPMCNNSGKFYLI